jgi:outer membrane usher protein
MGKGFGYSLGASKNRSETRISGRAVYRHELGISEASIQRPMNGDMAGSLSWAGGMGLIDGGIHFGRPVIDSFAVVDVEGLDEVPVYSGNHLVGRTGFRGSLMAPELISYTDNRISIRPSDLPIDYELTGKKRVVEMGQRGGARIRFKAYRFTAVEGNLFRISPDGDRKPLSTLPLEYEIDGEWHTSFTGQEGYFYLENLPPGDHALRVHSADGACQATIEVSDGDTIVNAVGDVICEPLETGK